MRGPTTAPPSAMPGIPRVAGLHNVEARILAEIGDDRSRFADGRALKAYAG
ncbi:hypothetical protein [Streptomyces sp. NPDC000994]